MSGRVEVVDLCDDDETPPPRTTQPPHHSSSSRYRRSPSPRRDRRDARDQSPRHTSREDNGMSPEDLERTVFAMKTVEKKIDELKNMGAEVPRAILDQFHSLLGLLKSRNKSEEKDVRGGTSYRDNDRSRNDRDYQRNNDKDRDRGRKEPEKTSPKSTAKKNEPVIGKRPKGKDKKMEEPLKTTTPRQSQ